MTLEVQGKVAEGASEPFLVMLLEIMLVLSEKWCLRTVYRLVCDWQPVWALWLMEITVPPFLCRFNLPAFYEEVRRLLQPNGAMAAWGYDLCGPTGTLADNR